MSDPIDRAAEVIYAEGMGLPKYAEGAHPDHNRHSYRGDCDCNHNDRRAARGVAESLGAAGLLVTPAHDAAVAAKALREAAVALDTEDPLMEHPVDDETVRIIRLLRERADRIERDEVSHE